MPWAPTRRLSRRSAGPSLPAGKCPSASILSDARNSCVRCLRPRSPASSCRLRSCMPASTSPWTRRLPTLFGRRKTAPCAWGSSWCGIGRCRVSDRREHRRCHGHGQDGPRALPGVDRPALAVVLPTLRGPGFPASCSMSAPMSTASPRTLSSSLSWASCTPRNVLKIARPRVGLLSIGEEQGKGNDLTAETFPLLEQLPIHFTGNVEGRDIYNGNADVIVCDGFVGNVALKTSEGLTKLVREMLKDSLKEDGDGAGRGAAVRKAFSAFKRRLDPTEYGGAPLLGVRAFASSATAPRTTALS